MPIVPHRTEYKKEENTGKIENYTGKIVGQFTMDADNAAVRAACIDMLKGGQR